MFVISEQLSGHVHVPPHGQAGSATWVLQKSANIQQFQSFSLGVLLSLFETERGGSRGSVSCFPWKKSCFFSEHLVAVGHEFGSSTNSVDSSVMSLNS